VPWASVRRLVCVSCFQGTNRQGGRRYDQVLVPLNYGSTVRLMFFDRDSSSIESLLPVSVSSKVRTTKE
jgi:hypothetical protein